MNSKKNLQNYFKIKFFGTLLLHFHRLVRYSRYVNQQQPPSNYEQNLERAAIATKQQIQQDPATAQTLAATPTLQDTVVEVEKELLDVIIARLDQEKMSPEEAQKLAQEFLSFLPIQDQRDLLTKLLKLSQDNPSTKGIYLTYAKP